MQWKTTRESANKFSHRGYLFQFLTSEILVGNFLSSIRISNVNTNHGNSKSFHIPCLLNKVESIFKH